MTVGRRLEREAERSSTIRVQGKSAEEIGDGHESSGRRAERRRPTKDETSSIGGKPVVKVTSTSSTLPFYVFGTGDVSFTIAVADERSSRRRCHRYP